MKRSTILPLILAAACAAPEPELFVSESESAAAAAGPSARHFATGSNGTMSVINTYYGWSRKWHAIEPARYDNELLFYSQIDAMIKIFRFAADGSMTQLAQHNNVRDDWDVLTRGNFAGTSAYEMVFYDRHSGDVQVYTLGASGSMSLLFADNIGTRWTIMESGYWGPGTYDQLLVYDRFTGRAEYLAVQNNQFVSVAARTWAKIWDQIVVARFDQDSYSDLLYFNQDRHEMKLYSMSSNHTGTLLQTINDLDYTESVHLVAGEFGGASGYQADLLMYNQVLGEGRFYTSAANGTLSLLESDTGWSTTYTHVAPVKNGNANTELLFYTNLIDVKLKAVRMSDDDGTMTAGIDQPQLDAWLAKTNKVFAAAGIRFVQEGPIADERNSGINRYGCTAGEWANSGFVKDDVIADATDLAEEYNGSQRTVMIFRVGSGSGCGNPDRNYVIMPGWTQARALYLNEDGKTIDEQGDVLTDGTETVGNFKLMPHELGHYFGLGHSHLASRPANADTLDADRDSGDWANIFDTAPAVPKEQTWSTWPVNACADDPANEIEITAMDLDTITINPDRHTVMGYGFNCEFTYWFSPEQIASTHRFLFEQRPDIAAY
jgi:hypothetical protein